LGFKTWDPNVYVQSLGSRHLDQTVSSSVQLLWLHNCHSVWHLLRAGPSADLKTQCHRPKLLAPLPPLRPMGGLPICSVHCCLQVHYLSHLHVAHLFVYPFSFASSPQEGFVVEVQQRKGPGDALVFTSGWKAIQFWSGTGWAKKSACT